MRERYRQPTSAPTSKPPSRCDRISRTRDNLDLIEDEHIQIFEAIRDRDPERAAKTMETHQSRTRDLRLAEMTHRR